MTPNTPMAIYTLATNSSLFRQICLWIAHGLIVGLIATIFFSAAIPAVTTPKVNACLCTDPGSAQVMYNSPGSIQIGGSLFMYQNLDTTLSKTVHCTDLACTAFTESP